MQVTRTCKAKELNWAALPELIERLKKVGFETGAVYAHLYRLPDDVAYESLEEVARDVAREGTPDGFFIRLQGAYPTIVIGSTTEVVSPTPTFVPTFGPTFELTISRSRKGNTIELGMSGLSDKTQFDSVTEFLGLEPIEPVALPSPRPRTAFIGHKFDTQGSNATNKLNSFLELLGFRVVTGRPYSPRSISEKVLSRIEGQELVFVILTPGGDDDTWLNQESAIAKVDGKELIVIKDRRANFTPGILADHEYIPFTAPNIERAFLPVLEGLRDLGYLSFR